MKNTAVVCQAAGGAKPPESVHHVSASKLWINPQSLSISDVVFLLPHLLLLSVLLMNSIGSLHSKTVMRTLAVVEIDESTYLIQSLPVRLETPFLAVYALALDRAVHALSYGVVSRFVVFGHGDSDIVLLQFIYVDVTAVLHATVGVMDESRQITASRLFYGHAESPESIIGSKGIRQAPTHYLLGIGIRHQMQVAAAFSQVNVGDVAHPQLVSGCGNESLDKVLPLVVAVVGVGRGAALAGLLHQLVAAQQVQERVATGHPVSIKHVTEHQP